MIKIKAINDFITLREQNKLPLPYINYLEKYYKELQESMLKYSDEPEEDFSMDDYNEFIILEAGDDLLKMQNLSIRKYEGKLYASFEFVNLLHIEGMNVFQTGVLYNNEQMGLFFSIQGTFNSEIEALFEEYSSYCDVKEEAIYG